MRLVCIGLGWLLVFAGLLSLAYDVVLWMDFGTYHAIPLGQMVFDLWPALLPNLQAGVQRYLHPAIWDPGIQSLLLMPGWLVFGAPGVILVILCRRRRKGMFR